MTNEVSATESTEPIHSKVGTTEPTRSITVKQQKALEVLLVGGTDQQAAETAGVARTTVNGWKNGSATFIEALKLARDELLKRTRARIHASTTIAVKALEEVAKDVRHPARVTAARAILDFSHQAIELEELEGRIEELEKTVEEQKGTR
jgi:hypothetical protein